MYHFDKEQSKVTLGGITVGGQPGENPTLLLGGLFYRGQYKKAGGLSDRVREDAKELIRKQQAMADTTGNPCMVDLHLNSEETMEGRIDVLLDAIPPDAPFSVDILGDLDLKRATLEHLDSLGELRRTVYNSVNLAVSENDYAELDALREHTPACAIVLAFNPKDVSVDGRLSMLNDGAGILDRGLLELVEDIGIGNVILDPGTMPFGQRAADTFKSIPVLKSRFGLPVGCAPHNLVEAWKWLKARRKEGDTEAYRHADTASNALAVTLGADFILYGPIGMANVAFPSVAMLDMVAAEGSDDFGLEQASGHPRRRLL